MKHVLGLLGFASFAALAFVASTAFMGAGLKAQTNEPSQSASSPAVQNASKLADIRAKLPVLKDYTDAEAVSFIQEVYYPGKTVEELAGALGVVLPKPKQPKKLGPIESWRYASCREKATAAPTPMGVTVGLRDCDSRFEQ